MKVSEIENTINGYIGYCCSDFDVTKREVVENIYSTANNRKIVYVIIESLKNGNYQRVNNSLKFLRDFYIYGSLNKKEKFDLKKHLKSSQIFQLLDHKLYSKNSIVRSTTIYTFGKLTIRENKKYLINSFHEFYIKKDPFLIPNVILEINWLSRKTNFDLLKRLLSHDHFAFRWSFFGYLISHTPDKERTLNLVRILENDENQYLSKEAKAWRKDNLECPSSKKSLITWDELTMMFHNMIFRTKYYNYSFSFLEKFIHYYIAHRVDLRAKIKDIIKRCGRNYNKQECEIVAFEQQLKENILREHRDVVN